jgi:hypothetical protein
MLIGFGVFITFVAMFDGTNSSGRVMMKGAA